MKTYKVKCIGSSIGYDLSNYVADDPVVKFIVMAQCNSYYKTKRYIL